MLGKVFSSAGKLGFWLIRMPSATSGVKIFPAESWNEVACGEGEAVGARMHAWMHPRALAGVAPLPPPVRARARACKAVRQCRPLVLLAPCTRSHPVDCGARRLRARVALKLVRPHHHPHHAQPAQQEERQQRRQQRRHWALAHVADVVLGAGGGRARARECRGEHVGKGGARFGPGPAAEQPRHSETSDGTQRGQGAAKAARRADGGRWRTLPRHPSGCWAAASPPPPPPPLLPAPSSGTCRSSPATRIAGGSRAPLPPAGSGPTGTTSCVLASGLANSPPSAARSGMPAAARTSPDDIMVEPICTPALSKVSVRTGPGGGASRSTGGGSRGLAGCPCPCHAACIPGGRGSQAANVSARRSHAAGAGARLALSSGPRECRDRVQTASAREPLSVLVV
jgi:hypothetical protein